ncbi:MAG: flagellar hook-basal body complex protein FliE [Pseudomonadota bacterium]
MNPMAAVKAYQSIQGAGSMPGVSGAAETQGPGFADLLQNVMGDMTQTTKVAEGQMTQLAQGSGSLIDVVTAVSSAEASLETVIAVRDQVIQAYQEIMRMPI